MFISCLSSVKQRCSTLLVSFLNQRQKVVNKSCHFYSNMSINRILCFKINEAKIQLFSKWGNFLTSMGHGHGMDLIFTILSSFCIIKHELWHMLLFFYYFFNFYFYFILLYNTVFVLPYIDMNPPRVYMRSQTWTPLPPPSHNISLGHPRAPAPSMLYPASDIDGQTWLCYFHTSLYDDLPQ